MRRNYQKYNKLNTERYSKGIKNSLYSLGSIIIGLLFTYLAMTNSSDNKKIDNKKNNSKIEEEAEDYSFVSVRSSSDKAKLGPPKEKKEK